MLVEQLMNQAWTTPLVTVEAQSRVGDALVEFRRHGVGALVVVADDGELAGLLTTTDVAVAASLRGSQLLGDPVAGIMSTEPLSCTPREDVERVIRRSIYGDAPYLPVVDEGGVCAILTLRDLVAAKVEEEALSDLVEPVPAMPPMERLLAKFSSGHRARSLAVNRS